MSFPSNLGSSLRFLHVVKQQLLAMHTLIDAKQIPIEKSNDFIEQALRLERSVDSNVYARSLNRYRRGRKILIVAACLVLAIAVVLYILPQLSPAQDTLQAVIQQVTSNFTLFATTASIASVILALVAGSFYIRFLEKNLFGKDLSALWSRTLARWLPELAQHHDVANISPDDIASLVGVQTRIQDVDLELD